jgi:hypothetical protein
MDWQALNPFFGGFPVFEPNTSFLLLFIIISADKPVFRDCLFVVVVVGLRSNSQKCSRQEIGREKNSIPLMHKQFHSRNSRKNSEKKLQ